MRRLLPCTFLLLAAATAHAQPQDLATLDTKGIARSAGLSVRVQHPAAWKRVRSDDELALAELRGPQGGLTAILQVSRGAARADMAELCKPERARTMLTDVNNHEPGTRVTDVFARTWQGRPAFELRYERSESDPPSFLVARSLVVCLKSSRLLVSCAGSGPAKHALAEIEPVCRQVLDSVTISED
jgi:hypothetical protein